MSNEHVNGQNQRRSTGSRGSKASIGMKTTQTSVKRNLEKGIANAAKNVVKVDNPVLNLAIADAIDWDGPDDPANPQNWPLSIRTGHVVLISIITLIVYVSELLVTPLHD